jgi:hypothetical protein
MLEIAAAGEDELEEALRLIHEKARAYRGPLVHEFAEIARRSAPEAIELRPDGEEVAERRTAQDRFSEVLALLMAVAFPPDRETEKRVRRELADVIGKPVRALRLRDGNDLIKVVDHLPPRARKADLNLQHALRRFLPLHDELDGQDDRRG